MSGSSLIVALTLIFGIVGCSNPKPPPASDCLSLLCDDEDNGVLLPVQTPTVYDLPTEAGPYRMITLRGGAVANRILVEEIDGRVNSVVTDIAASNFCIDVPLNSAADPGQYSFRVTAQDEDGNKSETPAIVDFEYDPSSAPVDGWECCAGGDLAEYSGEEECGNGKDDDCDGATDGADSDCSIACVDDDLEPNSSLPGAMVNMGTLSNRVLCGGDLDYYTFTVQAGTRLSIDLAFDNSNGNLDLYLIGPGANNSELVESKTDNDVEHIEYPEDSGQTVTEPGDYKVRVAGRTATVANNYSLSINVN